MKRIFLLNCILPLFLFFCCSLCVFSADLNEQADIEFKKGMLLFGEGSYEEALDKFQKVVDIAPSNANAYYYIGSSYSSLSEYEKAISFFQKALELDPDLVETYFQMGVAYYQMGWLREALEELGKAQIYTPENAMVYYYQGAIYYDMKKFHKSVVSFRKIREFDPALMAFSYYWEGVSLFQQGLYAKSKEPLQEVIKLSPNSPLGKSSGEFLEAVKEQTKPLCFDAKLGVEYDDNVTLQPVDEDAADISGKEDERAVINLKLTRRAFLEPGEVGISYSFYQSLHQDLDEYNLQGHTGSLYFASALRPFQPTVQYNYEYYFVDNDEYLEKNVLVPSVNISVASPHITQIYFKYESMNYLVSVEEDEYDRSGSANSVGVNQYFSIIEDKGFFRVGGEYKNNEADGDDWDYSGSKFVASLYIPLPISKMHMEIGGEYELNNFDNEDSFFEETREDKIVRAWLEFIYKLNNNWDVALNYRHINNRSNIDFYEYRRNITSLFASYSF